MAKKSELQKLKDKLWGECRRIILKRYGDTCYTCGATNLTGSNRQLGHFIPSGTCGVYLRYDLRNLRPQCMRCNLRLGGYGAMFYRKMEAEVGKKAINKLFQDIQKEAKSKEHYTKLLKEYELL